MQNNEERRLIRKSLSGNIEAWGEIVKEYKEKVYGLALGITREPADAEDIVQDTFVRAYDRLDQFDLERDFRPWLFTIAANLAKNKLRRGRFVNPLKHPGWLPGRDRDDPAEQVNREERINRMRKSLSDLDEKYRVPVVLRFYGDLSYEEISRVMDLPTGTVKTRLHRAKNNLKEVLEGGDDE